MEDLKKNAEYIEEDRATTIDRILRERGVPKVLTQLIAQKEAAMPSEENERAKSQEIPKAPRTPTRPLSQAQLNWRGPH